MKALLMSGPAGSGKSTWAKEYIKNNLNTIIISSDEIRYELFKSYWLTKDEEKQIIPEMLRRVQLAASQGIDVIIDVAVCKNKSRTKWYNRLRQYYKNILLVIIDVPLEISLKQNEERDRHVPEKVIRDMYDMFDEPDDNIKKLFSEIKYIKNY